jgi:hypothetical protein
VVATRTGGVGVVLGGQHPPGKAVDIDDPAGLAQAMVDVMGRAEHLRPSARLRAEGFSRKTWAESLFGLYGDLLSPKQPPQQPPRQPPRPPAE